VFFFVFEFLCFFWADGNEKKAKAVAQHGQMEMKKAKPLRSMGSVRTVVWA
jgi:hypothetical protein